MGKRNVFFILVLILAIASFFRFFDLKEIPLGLYPDEAMNGNNALEAVKTGDYKVFYPENNGREGLFINIQALSVAAFENEPWALRLVSAIFGTLTVLALFFLTKELFLSLSGITGSLIALFSSFFLAVSYWHINFSRIGFRAIMVPFFATLVILFLIKGMRKGNIGYLALAGIATGLGFHTYIAFRIMPIVLAVPIVWYLILWFKNRRFPEIKLACAPCAALFFIFVTFITALPMGWYFLQHPDDFTGRTAQVSIFSAQNPAKEFLISAGKTIGMLFVAGDCNWRHNFACRPQLHPLVALFFLIGVIAALQRFRKAPTEEKINFATLFVWLGAMALPAVFTREGLPHALRSIGMIPPVMILTGYGAWRALETILAWVERQKTAWPEKIGQLTRIRYEIIILFLAVCITIPWVTYRDYFVRWAYHPETYFALSTDLLNLGIFLDKLPQDTKKYVIVNLSGVDVRGIPMSAQTVMFATDTFREAEQQERNMVYLNPSRGVASIVEAIGARPQQKTIIAFLNGNDRELIRSMHKQFPTFKTKAPGDFVILQNY